MGNDDKLISRAQAGDEGAFTELMRAHYAFVYAIVIGIVNNPSDAEEVVQDTFLNAYRALAQYEEQIKLKSWLAKIARNRALNWLREQRIDTVSINEVSEDTLQTADSPDEQLIRNEQRDLIRRAIETLPQKDRDIAHSYYLEGASYDELIRAHGLSYKAISFRLSRAKQKLAKRLMHLITGVFVSPITTLKQTYSGGLTAMKVGTAPKITAGVVAIIVLAFIGTRQFISSKEDSPVSVEVVTSTPIKSAHLMAQTDTTRKGAVTAPLPEDKPRISAEEMQQIENFFAHLDELDVQSEVDNPQSLTGTDVARDADDHITTDTDAFAEGIEQSAEAVMNAYVEAFRNMDFEAMRELLTGAAKEDLESHLPDLNNIMAEINANGDDPVFKRMIESMWGRMFGGFEVVSSEYVGDEFHFRVRMPMPQIGALIEPLMRNTPEELRAELPEIDTSELPESVENVVKMRKEDGSWRIYEE